MFVKRETADDTIIIQTPEDLPKYLRAKQEWVNWYFVDLQKAFDPVNREALWYKMRKEGLTAGIAV